MNARAKTNHSPGVPLINVADSVSAIAVRCEEVLRQAGYKFAHCGGSNLVLGPDANVRAVSPELLASLLGRHAEFGCVSCEWVARDVPPVAVSELTSRIIAACMRR